VVAFLCVIISSLYGKEQTHPDAYSGPTQNDHAGDRLDTLWEEIVRLIDELPED
jgi:hypothetical protein